MGDAQSRTARRAGFSPVGAVNHRLGILAAERLSRFSDADLRLRSLISNAAQGALIGFSWSKWGDSSRSRRRPDARQDAMGIRGISTSESEQSTWRPLLRTALWVLCDSAGLGFARPVQPRTPRPARSLRRPAGHQRVGEPSRVALSIATALASVRPFAPGLCSAVGCSSGGLPHRFPLRPPRSRAVCCRLRAGKSGRYSGGTDGGGGHRRSDGHVGDAFMQRGRGPER